MAKLKFGYRLFPRSLFNKKEESTRCYDGGMVAHLSDLSQICQRAVCHPEKSTVHTPLNRLVDFQTGANPAAFFPLAACQPHDLSVEITLAEPTSGCEMLSAALLLTCLELYKDLRSHPKEEEIEPGGMRWFAQGHTVGSRSHSLLAQG